MALAVLRQVKRALSNLNPRELRETAERPVRVGLVAASTESLGRMETYFAPPHLSPERRAEAVRMLVRGSAFGCDIEIFESSLLRPGRAFSFDPEAPDDPVHLADVEQVGICRTAAVLLDPGRHAGSVGP